MINIQQHIEDFKLRVEEDRSFCEELFNETTVKVLAAKYAYYIKNNSYLKDDTYDIMEKSWFIMGRALEFLKEDETTPCIDFDFKHPKAEEAIKLYEKLKHR